MAGNQVYAIASGWGAAREDAVSHFTMDAAGNLTFAGCIGDLPGCTATSPDQVIVGAVALAAAGGQLYVASWGLGTVGLAVTGDGANLYATAYFGRAVSHFTIAGFTTANPPGGPRPQPCLFGCSQARQPLGHTLPASAALAR